MDCTVGHGEVRNQIMLLIGFEEDAEVVPGLELIARDRVHPKITRFQIKEIAPPIPLQLQWSITNLLSVVVKEAVMGNLKNAILLCSASLCTAQPVT